MWVKYVGQRGQVILEKVVKVWTIEKGVKTECGFVNLDGIQSEFLTDQDAVTFLNDVFGK